MIDEKKLIEKIQARRDFWTNKSTKCIEDGNLFKANMCNIMATELNGILCMIDEQPKAGEWIPCSEKLPLDPCWDWRGIDAPCPKVEITTVDRERYIGYFIGGGWYDINGNCIDVVAWKEPSEPWKEV